MTESELYEKMWFQTLVENTITDHFKKKHPDGIWGETFEIFGTVIIFTYRLRVPGSSSSWEEKYKRREKFTLIQILQMLTENNKKEEK